MQPTLFSGPQLRKMLKWTKPLPLEDERVRLLHEVSHLNGLIFEALYHAFHELTFLFSLPVL